jgi:hypothetical protein
MDHDSFGGREVQLVRHVWQRRQTVEEAEPTKSDLN